MFTIIFLFIIKLSFEGNRWDVDDQLLITPYPAQVNFVQNSNDSISLDTTISLSMNDNCNYLCKTFLSNNFNHSITSSLIKQQGLNNFRLSIHEILDLKKIKPNIKSNIKSIKVDLIDKLSYPDLKIGVNESYQLNISQDNIIIKAPNVYGARHAFETLNQLIKTNGQSFYIPNIPITITDYPRFKWRGLFVDPARNPILPSMFYSIIDSLALAKANVLHIRLSDAQMFVFESLKYPNLCDKGVYEKEYILTQSAIQKIVEYGKNRGIIVYGEIDMPAHTASWDLGYKGVVADYWDNLAKVTDDYSENILALNPSNKKTFDIIDSLIDELGKSFGEYVHLGGDGVDYNAWSLSKDYDNIKKFMDKNKIASLEELEKYFDFYAIKSAIKKKKTPILWEEVLKFKPDKNTIIHVWKDPNKIKEAAQEGYKVIYSVGYHLDKHLPTCFENGTGGCGSSHWMWTWTNRDMYHYDPSRSFSHDIEENVLGAEAGSKGENVDQQNFFNRVFPRFLAIAERMWSQQEIRNSASHEVRANYLRCLALRRGIFRSGPLYQSYCPFKNE